MTGTLTPERPAALAPCCRGWIAEEVHRRVGVVRSASGPWATGRPGAMSLMVAPATLGVEIPRHPRDIELDWDEIVAALARLEGSPVAVRVVEPGDPEMLAVVMRGHLAPARHDRPPTVFWPVQGPMPAAAGDVEEPGIHLQRERFGGALSRAGGTVLLVVQGPLVVNVRRI